MYIEKYSITKKFEINHHLFIIFFHFTEPDSNKINKSCNTIDKNLAELVDEIVGFQVDMINSQENDDMDIDTDSYEYVKNSPLISYLNKLKSSVENTRNALGGEEISEKSEKSANDIKAATDDMV